MGDNGQHGRSWSFFSRVRGLSDGHGGGCYRDGTRAAMERLKISSVVKRRSIHEITVMSFE